jgi:hypothetical protein
MKHTVTISYAQKQWACSYSTPLWNKHTAHSSRYVAFCDLQAFVLEYIKRARTVHTDPRYLESFDVAEKWARSRWRRFWYWLIEKSTVGW